MVAQSRRGLSMRLLGAISDCGVDRVGGTQLALRCSGLPWGSGHVPIEDPGTSSSPRVGQLQHPRGEETGLSSR